MSTTGQFRPDSNDPAELTRLTANKLSPGVEADNPSIMDHHTSTEIGPAGVSSRQDTLSANYSATQDQRHSIRNGHLDPIKRSRYVLIFVISTLISFLGLLLVLAWVFRLRPKPGISFSNAPQLTNLHPILMYTFMATLNMYSVLIYRTHYGSPKGVLKIIHASIMAICLVAGVLGVLVIFRAHSMVNGPDWYSLHSWIGTLTLTLFAVQFVAGFVAFLKPGLPLQTKLTLMPWHRFLGAVIMVLSAAAVVTGIAEFALFAGDEYNKFQPVTFAANFAGICVVLSTIGFAYLLTEPNYIRPVRADENEPAENLKR